jgi:hypothetical protein
VRRQGPKKVALVAVAAVMAVVATGCTSGTAATSTTVGPLPAGPKPSNIAKQVCQKEAQTDIDSALGVTATVSKPTWVDHLYSCGYGYSTGTMLLSVKELSSWSQTYAYYNSIGTQQGRARTLQGLGQGAFQTGNGSVVVRKDWKVLLVNTTGLPGQFGVPPTSSADVAVTVADVILGCWAGD